MAGPFAIPIVRGVFPQPQVEHTSDIDRAARKARVPEAEVEPVHPLVGGRFDNIRQDLQTYTKKGEFYAQRIGTKLDVEETKA